MQQPLLEASSRAVSIMLHVQIQGQRKKLQSAGGDSCGTEGRGGGTEGSSLEGVTLIGPSPSFIIMDQTSKLRACYRILEDNVSTALRTRIGDRERLRPVRDDGLLFMALMEEVSNSAQKVNMLLYNT